MYELESWSKTRWVSKTRYYEVLVHQDLFGWVLSTRGNGRLDTALGRTHLVRAVGLEAARARAASMEKRRLRRGYRLAAS